MGLFDLLEFLGNFVLDLVETWLCFSWNLIFLDKFGGEEVDEEGRREGRSW